MPPAGPLGTMNPTMVFVLCGFVFAVLAAMAGAWALAIGWLASGRPLLPKAKLRAVPWGIGSVVLAAFLWVGLQMAARTAYVGFVAPNPPVLQAKKLVKDVAKQAADPAPIGELSAMEIMAIISVSNLLTVALIPIVLSITSRARLDDLGLTGKGDMQNAGRGVAAYFLMAPVVFAVMISSSLVWTKVLKHQVDAHPVAKMLAHGLTWQLVALATISAAVLAPLAEEFLFRGVLLGWLTRAWNRIPKRKPAIEGDFGPSWEEHQVTAGGQTTVPVIDDPNLYRSPFAVDLAGSASAETKPERVSLIWPNVIVSLLFAGLHFPQWPAPIALFLLSLGLGFLFQRTGSLIGPIVLHATFNGVSTTLMFLAVSSGIPLSQPKATIEIQTPKPNARAHVVSSGFSENDDSAGSSMNDLRGVGESRCNAVLAEL